MAHQNGMITGPVSLHADVYPTLGIGPHNGRYDLAWANSNQHGATNAYSLRKPVRSDSKEALTEQDYKDLDYGYTIPVYSTYQQMQAAMPSGWTYLPPVPLQDRQRQTDWEGYNHYAQNPVELTLGNGQPRIGGTCNLVLSCELTWLLEWHTWQGYQGTQMKYLNVGVCAKGVGYYPFTDTDQGLTLDSIDHTKLNFSVPSTQFQQGKTYQLGLVLTTWDGLNGAGRWYLPDSTLAARWWLVGMGTFPTITPGAPYTPLEQFSIMFSDTYTKLTIDGADYVFTNTRFTATASMGAGYTTGTAQLSVEFHVTGVYDGTSTLKDITIGTMSASLAGGQTASKQVTYNNQLRFIVARERLTVEARIVLKEGTKTYQQTRTFNIEASVV